MTLQPVQNSIPPQTFLELITTLCIADTKFTSASTNVYDTKFITVTDVASMHSSTTTNAPLSVFTLRTSSTYHTLTLLFQTQIRSYSKETKRKMHSSIFSKSVQLPEYLNWIKDE